MDYGATYDRSNYIMPTLDEETSETVTQRARKIVKLDVFENAATPDVEVATDSMVGKPSPTVPPTISTSSASMFDALIGSKDAMLIKGTALYRLLLHEQTNGQTDRQTSI
jgi:hypothetical protein